MQALDALKPMHDFEAFAIPDVGHELYQVRRDTEDDQLLSTGIAPEVLDTIRDWLSQHIGKR